MPTTLSSPDTLARAVLEKTPPPAAVLTPEQQAAKSIKEKVAEGTPRSALESIRERKIPIDQGKIDRANDSNIGVERNPDGKRKLDPVERLRLRDAKTYETSIKNFLERGYGGLNAGEQSEIRTKVEQAIRAWPNADTLLGRPGSAGAKAMIEDFIKDSKYSAKVRSIFEAGIGTDVPEIASALKTALEDSQKQERDKKAEIAKNASEKTTVDTGLEQFDDKTSSGGVKGKKLQELEDVTNNLPTLTADLEQKQDRLSDLTISLQGVEGRLRVALQRGNDTVDIENLLSTKRGEVRTLQREISKVNDTISKKAVLEKERTDLQNRKRDLETARTTFDTELDDIVRERVGAQAEYASAKMTREGQEQGFVDGLRNVFSESAYLQLEEKVAAYETAQRTLGEQEILNTPDPAKKAILQGLLDRWEMKKTIGIFGKRTISVIDGQKSKVDWDRCMIDMTQGPKDIMKAMLVDGGMLPADADRKLLDLAFVAEMQPKVLERLTTRRIETGKLTQDDARRIIENPTWGKEIINTAIKNRSDIRDALAELEQTGILRGGIAESLKNKSGGSVWKFLLILLGIGALGVGPIGMGLKNALSEK